MSSWSLFLEKNPEQKDFFERTFNSYQDFKDELLKWQNKYLQLLIIRTSETLLDSDPLQSNYVYRRIRFYCKHSINYKSKINDGSRPNQHTYSPECSFKASISLVLTNLRKEQLFYPFFQFSKGFLLEHNHDVSKDLTYFFVLYFLTLFIGNKSLLA